MANKKENSYIQTGEGIFTSGKVGKPKRAVVTPDDLGASGPAKKRVRIPGLSGSYLDARFDENGVALDEIKPATLADLKGVFGEAVEEVDVIDLPQD